MRDYFYVYVYYDPRQSPPEPIYVGKGHGKRCYDHVRKGAKNTHLANKLAKIKQAGLQPIVEFAKTNMRHEDAVVLEKQLIAKIGRADKKLGSLCNWTDGGDGTAGYKHSEKTKLLLSEQRKGKQQTPKQYEANCSRKVSDETRKRIAEANKGHVRRTPQQIEAFREYAKNREITNEMRAKWSKTRLGNTPTKIVYPPQQELVEMILQSSRNQVAKHLGINYSSLVNYLKRRAIEIPDARFTC